MSFYTCICILCCLMRFPLYNLKHYTNFKLLPDKKKNCKDIETNFYHLLKFLNSTFFMEIILFVSILKLCSSVDNGLARH